MSNIHLPNTPIKHNPSSTYPSVLLVTVTETETRAVFNAAALSNHNSPSTWYIDKKTYYDLGLIGKTNIWLVRSEQGSITPGGSFITIQSAIDTLNPVAIIMVGTAFGINPHTQRIGDILISKQLVSYEPQRTSIDTNGRSIPILRGDRVTASVRLLDRCRDAAIHWSDKNTNIYFGPILSGEKLLDDTFTTSQLLQLEPEAIGCETEGAGLYVTANNHNIDWIVIKSIYTWPFINTTQDIDINHTIAA